MSVSALNCYTWMRFSAHINTVIIIINYKSNHWLSSLTCLCDVCHYSSAAKLTKVCLESSARFVFTLPYKLRDLSLLTHFCLCCNIQSWVATVRTTHTSVHWRSAFRNASELLINFGLGAPVQTCKHSLGQNKCDDNQFHPTSACTDQVLPTKKIWLIFTKGLQSRWEDHEITGVKKKNHLRLILWIFFCDSFFSDCRASILSYSYCLTAPFSPMLTGR